MLKELSVRYVSDLTEDSWKSLPTFADLTANYDKFQDEVYSLYPGVKRTHEFTTLDVRRLINAQRKDKIVNDINDYSLFYVKAMLMLKGLLAKSRIDATAANAYLAEVLHPALEKPIRERLVHAFPDRHPDTPYTLDQFHSAVTYVLQHLNDDADAIFHAAGNNSRANDQSDATSQPRTRSPITSEDVASITDLLS